MNLQSPLWENHAQAWVVDNRRSLIQVRPNYLTEMCSGSEEGSYSRLIEFCTTQL